jgi:hypothetical protein
MERHPPAAESLVIWQGLLHGSTARGNIQQHSEEALFRRQDLAAVLHDFDGAGAFDRGDGKFLESPDVIQGHRHVGIARASEQEERCVSPRVAAVSFFFGEGAGANLVDHVGRLGDTEDVKNEGHAAIAHDREPRERALRSLRAQEAIPEWLAGGPNRHEGEERDNWFEVRGEIDNSS